MLTVVFFAALFVVGVLRPALRPELCPALRPALRSELRPELRPALYSGLRPAYQPREVAVELARSRTPERQNV